MKYFLGQYSHNGDEVASWVSSIPSNNLEVDLIYTSKNTDEINLTYMNSFQNIGLKLKNNEKFNMNTTYYCRFAILLDSDINDSNLYKELQIRLVSSENNKIKENEVQQYIKTIKEKKDNQWKIVDFIFTPQTGIFNTILFVLSRGNYNHTEIPKIIFLECSTVNNLKKVNNNSSSVIKDAPYIKIGVQSIPHLRMMINNEEIYTGKSGIYELKNSDIKIESIGFINHANYWNLLNPKDNITTESDEDILQKLKESFIFSVSQSEYENGAKTSYLIENNGIISINNDSDNEYTYYKRVLNNRKFHNFTLDYIYEEQDKTEE